MADRNVVPTPERLWVQHGSHPSHTLPSSQEDSSFVGRIKRVNGRIKRLSLYVLKNMAGLREICFAMAFQSWISKLSCTEKKELKQGELLSIHRYAGCYRQLLKDQAFLWTYFPV